MADISFFRLKSNARYQTTQRIQNSFPQDFRIRDSEYSIGAQLYNPLSGVLEEQNKEVQRVVHNYIPQTFSDKEIDKVYHVPNIIGTSTSFKAYYDSTSYVTPEKVTGGIDEFWYSKLANRLEIVSTQECTKPITRNASLVYKKSIEYQWNIKNEINYLNTDPISFVGTEVAFGTSTQTNLVEYYSFSPVSTSTDQLSISFTSTHQLYNKEISFESYFKLEDIACDSIVTEIGIDSVGTNTSTISISHNPYKVINLFYPAQTSTGSPFVNLFFKNSTDVLSTAGEIKLFKGSYRLVDNNYNIVERTSSPIIDFNGGNESGWCWIDIQNGSSLGNPNGRLNGQPAFFCVKGVTISDDHRSEIIATPFNGQHRGNTHWKQILSVEPINFSQNMEYSIGLRNKFEDKQHFNPMQIFTDKYFESPLFYNLSIGEGKSFLNFNTFDDNSLDLITPSYETKKTFELVNSNGDPIELIDICLDSEEQVIYGIDVDTVYMFDAFDVMPSQESLLFLQEKRSDTPALKFIEEYKFQQVQKDTNITLEIEWVRRDSYLQRYKIWVKKPSGALKSLDLAGAESDFYLNTNWTTHEDAQSVIQNKDSIFQNIKIDYFIDEFGDYCFGIEAEYLEDDLESRYKETDVIIVSCKKKHSLQELSFVTPEIPTNIDINPKGEICIAYEDTSLTSNLYKELVIKRRFDYYLYTDENTPIYLREKYQKITIDLEDFMCKRKVLILDNNYTIQDDEVECGMILVETDSATPDIYLPTITADIDGSEVTVARWGSNPLTLHKGATSSDTIDGAASLTFSVDKMSYTLIAIYAKQLWKII